MELLRETSLKKIDSKFSELMKQKADIYESMISLEADVIISLFSSAKSHYHDGDYGSTVTDFTTLISKFPEYLFPHGNDYCAVIGGTTLANTSKWREHIFVGDFCTGTIWAIDIKNNSELKILEKNVIPFSITTINDSGNESLVIGTTSGQIFELELP